VFVIHCTAAAQTHHSKFTLPAIALPAAISRAVFHQAQHLLTATVPDLGTDVHITFFNPSRVTSYDVLSRSIEALQSAVCLPFSLSITEYPFTFDPVRCQIAIEQYLSRVLETNGWWRLCRNLVQGNSECGFGLADFQMHASLSTGPPSFSKFRKASATTNPPQHLFSLSVSGDVKFFKLQKSAAIIDKRLRDMRLDSLGGLVLPNLRTGFAVRYSTQVPSSIADYWWFAHGMVISSVKAVFEITFVPGSEDQTLTYPEQCFLQPMALREKPLRTIKGPADDFERDFTKFIKTVVDALQADFIP
jgi:hypothetical protein